MAQTYLRYYYLFYPLFQVSLKWDIQDLWGSLLGGSLDPALGIAHRLLGIGTRRIILYALLIYYFRDSRGPYGLDSYHAGAPL